MNLESNSDSEVPHHDIFTPTTCSNTTTTNNSSDQGGLLLPDATPTASLNLITASRFCDTQSIVNATDSRYYSQSVVANSQHSDCKSDTSSQISQNSKTKQETPVVDVEQSLSASLLSLQHSKHWKSIPHNASSDRFWRSNFWLMTRG